MSISPVLSISSYASIYVSSKGPEDDEHERIINLLKQLGITSTGNKQADKALLRAALQKMADNMSSGGTSSSKYNPFKDIMESLDIETTGNVDKDYNNVIKELDYRISQSNDDEEKQYYQALRDEIDSKYTENNYDNSRSNQFTGASQLADLNKYMLL